MREGEISYLRSCRWDNELKLTFFAESCRHFQESVSRRPSKRSVFCCVANRKQLHHPRHPFRKSIDKIIAVAKWIPVNLCRFTLVTAGLRAPATTNNKQKKNLNSDKSQQTTEQCFLLQVFSTCRLVYCYFQQQKCDAMYRYVYSISAFLVLLFNPQLYYKFLHLRAKIGSPYEWLLASLGPMKISFIKTRLFITKSEGISQRGP